MKKASAYEAMSKVHHAFTMEGCSSPINVRLAENSETKEHRRRLSENLAVTINATTNDWSQKYFAPGSRDQAVSLDMPNSFAWQNANALCGLMDSHRATALEGFATKQIVGPKDANIFVYHLPVKLTNIITI